MLLLLADDAAGHATDHAPGAAHAAEHAEQAAHGGGGVNPLGHVLDKELFSIGDVPILTMHMMTLAVAAILCVLVMQKVADAIATGPASEGHDRYLAKGRFSQLIEVIILYMRDNVIGPVLGDQTNKFLPYLLSLFFFILFNNVLGLVPLLDAQHLLGAVGWGDSHFAIVGGTATGNLAVTAALSIVAFFVINGHGIKANGFGGWAHHLLGGAPAYLAPIMVPVELLSTFIKPAALAIRLFANMLAGHTLMAMLALFGVLAYQGAGDLLAGGVTLVSLPFAVAIYFLEIFVAFLQAFIFMFLTTVFIGQLSHHHDEHDHGEDAAHHLEYGAEVTHA